MFPKKERVPRKEFSSLLKKAKTFSLDPFSVKVSFKDKNSFKGQEFAVVLPGSWQKQKPLRNKIKRRIASLVRKYKKSISQPLSIICFAKKEAATLSYKETELKIKEIFLKIGKIF